MTRNDKHAFEVTVDQIAGLDAHAFNLQGDIVIDDLAAYPLILRVVTAREDGEA